MIQKVETSIIRELRTIKEAFKLLDLSYLTCKQTMSLLRYNNTTYLQPRTQAFILSRSSVQMSLVFSSFDYFYFILS